MPRRKNSAVPTPSSSSSNVACSSSGPLQCCASGGSHGEEVPSGNQFIINLTPRGSVGLRAQNESTT